MNDDLKAAVLAAAVATRVAAEAVVYALNSDALDGFIEYVPPARALSSGVEAGIALGYLLAKRPELMNNRASSEPIVKTMLAGIIKQCIAEKGKGGGS